MIRSGSSNLNAPKSEATKQHKISVNDNIYPNLCAPHSAKRIFKNAVWIVKGRFLENFIAYKKEETDLRLTSL
jgi:hypothetical protein